MAVNKSALFNDTQKRTAELAKALAHPARIAILELLSQRESCICGDITDELPLAQSTISQHLKALKKCGIIKGEVDGVRTCYCLNMKVVDEFYALINPLMAKLQQPVKQDCC